ncbi:MAG TPA: hypothetical protein VNH53_00960 [Sphingomicrobium sp.]|jgi:hypothetical protein|nr:hypothetical protein [Sphingomicrobium sp.]
MSIMIAALALAAAQNPQSAPLATPGRQAERQQHGQHAQHGTKEARECCCKGKMAAGQKMECCAKHGQSAGGNSPASGHDGHAGHDH